MGSSLFTNPSAMTALRTLRAVENNLSATQNRIATGKRINEAADHASYWLVSNAMKSDSSTSSVIRDSLRVGKAPVDQAYLTVQEVKKNLQEIKEMTTSLIGLPLAAQKATLDAIESKKEAMKLAIQAGGINGQNILIKQEAASGATDAQTKGNGAKLEIAAGYRRVYSKGKDNVAIDVITLDFTGYQLMNAMTGTAAVDDSKLFEGTPLAALFSTGFGPIKPSDSSAAVSDTPYNKSDIENWVNIVQTVIEKLDPIDTKVANAKKQIDSQYEFVNNLIDNLDKSVGALVDADMNAESAKLAALQVQQQLAVQSLSIANQATQSILTLFR